MSIGPNIGQSQFSRWSDDVHQETPDGVYQGDVELSLEPAITSNSTSALASARAVFSDVLDRFIEACAG
jgi:hypothetical protein